MVTVDWADAVPAIALRVARAMRVFFMKKVSRVEHGCEVKTSFPLDQGVGYDSTRYDDGLLDWTLQIRRSVASTLPNCCAKAKLLVVTLVFWGLRQAPGSAAVKVGGQSRRTFASSSRCGRLLT
jgi:hypothetical protein